MKYKSSLVNHGDTILLKEIPTLKDSDFIDTLSNLLSKGCQLSAYFADEKENLLYAVCSDIDNGFLHILSGETASKRFDSITPIFPQAHLFEREIYESAGFIPEGHPWLKPVRFSNNGRSEIGVQPFFKIHGDEIHEVAVGPVHAGVIEPGHFRFQCHGETVYHLEISLGYQNRGIEKKLIGGPFNSTIFQMETVAGDSTIGHATAYSQVIELLTDTNIAPSDNLIRAISLELERCANHIGDIGALAGDAGFLPTQSYCGRIRGDFLNMTALICGNRFGRGIVVPGGVGYRLNEDIINELYSQITIGLKEFLDASKLMFENPTIVSRFEFIGNVSYEDSKKIGLVGPAARACGIARDVRQDYAYGYYRFSSIPISTYDTGNVFGRAYVRWLEVQASVKFITDQLNRLKNSIKKSDKENLKISLPLKKDSLAVSLIEGWRGEICHVAITDNDGNLKNYKIYDPSFHNWFGLALSLRNQQISDFPLCNKSFNLSYCGHDL